MTRPYAADRPTETRRTPSTLAFCRELGSNILHRPEGFGESSLPSYVSRCLGIPTSNPRICFAGGWLAPPGLGLLIVKTPAEAV
jgi:hypothetical protein